MTKYLLILTLTFGQVFHLLAQTASIDKIELLVKSIDNDSSLVLKEFDATEVYEQAFDGGGIIEIYFDKEGIKKIVQEIGVSFGRLTTVIYFEQEVPKKITDKEENFKWKEDDSGWDYSSLNEIFKADIYIFDWKLDINQTLKKGQRNLSEGSCAVFEYEPLIELSKKLIGTN
jgi:hypothetical protein